jgi:carbonic anhydrase
MRARQSPQIRAIGSRIAPECCFDTARGDVFACRVAGNFAIDDIPTSFKYAVLVSNTPLIVVLGRESCSASQHAMEPRCSTAPKSAGRLPNRLTFP